MSTTISQNSKDLFLHIAEKHFHSHPLHHQFMERENVIRMLIEYGEIEKAKELQKLL
jgi:hypothetical protein